MAEVVEFHIEEMITELELMEKLHVFSKEEVKTIKKQRKQYEYKLQRVSKNKDDLLRYIQYEMDLLKTVKQRMAEKGMQSKKNNLEFAIINHINRLFQYGIRRFSHDVKIWLSFINFCKQVRHFSHVSRLLDQVLELHGSNKPMLFKLAAHWEWDDNKSIERARKFIHQGLHLHKESKMLFFEGFKLELSYANAKREELSEKGNGDISENEDPILQGKLAEVIYESATKKIHDVTFLVQLLNAAEKYSFTGPLQNKIIEDISTKFPNEEITWNTLAKRELDMPGSLKDRLEKCIATYKKGVEVISTQKMWEYYLDYILELNEDLTTLPNFKKNCLKTAFDAAHNANMLLEKHYMIWTRKVEGDEIAKVLQWGTMRFPESHKLWSSLLRYYLSTGKETEAMATFDKIKWKQEISDPLNLWLLVLKYFQITDPPKADIIWLEGANNPDVGTFLKGKYVEWISVLRGINAARKAYENLAYNPPFSLDLHTTMLKLEDAQPKLNLKCARQVYENAIRQFGEENTDVWIWYIKFEEKYGNGENVLHLYERATRTLKNHLVDVFISDFNLNRADHGK